MPTFYQRLYIKGILLFTFFFFVTIVLFGQSNDSGQDEMIYLSIPDTIVQVGRQFCVPLFGKNLDFPNSVDFSISWNEDSLTYQGLDNVALHLFGPTVVYTVSRSMISLSWSDIDYSRAYFPDPEPLFELCFTANKQGSAEINIAASASIESLDGSIHSLDVNVKNGTIQIVEFLPICLEGTLVINPENLRDGGFYQVEDWIITDAGISSEVNVTLQAGNSITLITGFHASGNFLAQIKDIDCKDNYVNNSQSPKSKLIKNPSTIVKDYELTISPNPFYNTTTIRYYLPKQTKTRLRVYSVEGKLLDEILTTSTKNAGAYEATFSSDAYLNPIFFVELTTEDAVIVQKIINIR